MFEVKIVETSRNLNAIETMRVKRYSNGEKVRPDMLIEVTAYALCNVHNDESRNKDYDVLVLLTDEGVYYTSSPVFIDNMGEIKRDLDESGMSYDAIISKVGTKPSKNYPDRNCLLPQFVDLKVNGFERA